MMLVGWIQLVDGIPVVAAPAPMALSAANAPCWIVPTVLFGKSIKLKRKNTALGSVKNAAKSSKFGLTKKNQKIYILLCGIAPNVGVIMKVAGPPKMEWLVLKENSGGNKNELSF
jgi:hypothetical protein